MLKSLNKSRLLQIRLIQKPNQNKNIINTQIINEENRGIFNRNNYIIQTTRPNPYLLIRRNYNYYENLVKGEKVLYKVLAKGVSVVKTIRASNEYHMTKEIMFKTYLWLKVKLQDHVVNHPKVQNAIKEFERKLEEAKRE